MIKGVVILAVNPLTASQSMLLVDRYIGKSLTGPMPKDPLRVPIFFTICLLSSSLTIHSYCCEKEVLQLSLNVPEWIQKRGTTGAHPAD